MCCRLCHSDRITKVVDLGFHPLADTFLPKDVLAEGEVSYPLELALCHNCAHVFTLHAISPEDRYQKQDYSYDSSNSEVSVRHFGEFCDAVLEALKPPPDGLVVDVGSNVGTLLGHFQSRGHKNVLGVEPSGNIARLARAAGIPTLNDFFTDAAGAKILETGQVEVLLSSNVVNHADDLNAFLATARQVLSPTGAFVFEVPYLLDLVERRAFDTIYHEHVHYHSIRPLESCLRRQGFSIFKVERIDYMCGSIRVYARKGGERAADIAALTDAEARAGLGLLETYANFMRDVRRVKLEVNERLHSIRANGGKIVGVGAATKGNTFLNYCRLDADVISAVSDTSKLKIGKYTPGSHIQIIADEEIGAEGFTHAVILPWNIADFLVKKLGHLGLEFYVPQVRNLSK